METNEFDLLTQKEAAKLLRMSESWLEKHRWQKDGVPYVKIGGRIFYQKVDLIKWLKTMKM